MWAFVPITGQTSAYFNDTSNVTQVIQAGIWENIEDTGCSENHGHEDCSKLKIKGVSFDGSNIHATIKNTGVSMQTNGRYEIYFSERGNPKNGNKISETLTFKPILKDQEQDLVFTPAKSGYYMFKIFDEDHPGKGVHELWSGKIEVNFKAKENASSDTPDNDRSEKQEEANISNEIGNDSSKSFIEKSEENIDKGENIK